MIAENRHKKSILAVNVGLFANTILAIAKTSVGIIGHSPALLADGINSTSDVAYGVVVNIFMRLSGKPADEEHPLWTRPPRIHSGRRGWSFRHNHGNIYFLGLH